MCEAAVIAMSVSTLSTHSTPLVPRTEVSSDGLCEGWAACKQVVPAVSSSPAGLRAPCIHAPLVPQQHEMCSETTLGPIALVTEVQSLYNHIALSVRRITEGARSPRGRRSVAIHTHCS